MSERRPYSRVYWSVRALRGSLTADGPIAETMAA